MIRAPRRTIEAQACPIAAENIIVGFAKERGLGPPERDGAVIIRVPVEEVA